MPETKIKENQRAAEKHRAKPLLLYGSRRESRRFSDFKALKISDFLARGRRPDKAGIDLFASQPPLQKAPPSKSQTGLLDFWPLSKALTNTARRVSATGRR
jgi:hypothetical protein